MFHATFINNIPVILWRSDLWVEESVVNKIRLTLCLSCNIFTSNISMASWSDTLSNHKIILSLDTREKNLSIKKLRVCEIHFKMAFFGEKLNKQVNCTKPRINALHNHVVPSDQLKAYLVQACRCEGNYNLLKKKFKYSNSRTILAKINIIVLLMFMLLLILVILFDLFEWKIQCRIFITSLYLYCR